MKVNTNHIYESLFTSGQDYDANLLWAKARVTPLSGYTVPRSELCGALISSRLLLTVAAALYKLEEKPTSAGVPLVL